MSTQTLQEDQLIELLLQLKVCYVHQLWSTHMPEGFIMAQKTTPEQAKAILNAQPQIAYALMSVMVNLNAVNVEVIQVRDASLGVGLCR